MVHVNREVKFYENSKKKNFFFGGGGEGGVRMDVKEELKFL